MPFHNAVIALYAVCIVQAPAATAQAPREVTVFAAASLTNVLQAVGDSFTAASGVRVKSSFAASSSLARQIEAGAGAQLFVSADDVWMDYLAKRNLIDAPSRRALLGNRLAVVVPIDRPVRLEISGDRSWLALLPAGFIATGDPAHVPVGRYAQQALTRLGVWAEVAPRLARADNVRNALVLVERGEAAAGIVYGTDAAMSRKVSVAGLFPEAAHDPIVYPVALLAGRGQGDARMLYDFLIGPTARAAFTSHGFSVR